MVLCNHPDFDFKKACFDAYNRWLHTQGRGETMTNSATTFTAQAGTVGSYGTFTLSSAGVWTYTMDGAHDAFVAGQVYTDTFTAVSADGTSQSVTVNITGTNDAAVIGGVTTGALTETDTALTTSGALTITDVDSATTFVAQASTAGDHGYGSFTLATNGAWTYTMGTAHNEFVAGQLYTDSFTAVSADGTSKTVTVSGHTLSGTDAANYTVANTGSATANITPKALTLSGITASNKVYDGSTLATITSGTFGNLFNGETLLNCLPTHITCTGENEALGTGDWSSLECA